MLACQASETSDDDLPPGINLLGRHAARPIVVPVTPRCWPDVDSQETRGSSLGNAWVCLAWTRGGCSRGAECTALHRLPSLAEEQRLIFSADWVDYDVFGRPRACTLGAVPTPIESSTLFVRGLGVDLSQREVRLALERFGEWGQLARTWCGVEPGTGYVKYRWRASAQFAAEATDGRSLEPEGGPPLAVSFATQDPEVEQTQNARQLALRSVEEAKKRRDRQHDLYARLEMEARAGKAARTTSHGVSAHSDGGMTSPAEVREAMASPAVWQIEPGQRLTAVAETYGCTDLATTKEGPSPSAGSAVGVTDAAAAGGGVSACPLPDGWVSGVDPASGFVYFHHLSTGQSQWERPGAVGAGFEE
jgi:hypothetical protein